MSSMSHFIASDALSSPVSDSAPWSGPNDASFNNYSAFDYSLPPSPHPSSVPDSPVLPLKSRLVTPDSSSEGEHLCMPTHQLFELPITPLSGRSPSPQLREQRAYSPVPKRSSVTGTRKPRERICTKDFIPPDVSGLSKREARLVKNRAAAFLSRQRKREEFETMEVKVAELEQENARLLAIARGQADPAFAELEQLRAQLAAAEQRSNELSAQLARVEASPPPPAVKMESEEPELPAPTPRPAAPQQTHKSGASLGLMVLLCALPSLLSLPTHPAMPSSSFSFPLSETSLSSLSSSSFDISSLISNEDRNWSFNHNTMDLDMDMADDERPHSVLLPSINSGKLELANHGLDISFDAIPSEDGKIRVRIHPPPASVLSSVSTPDSASPSYMKSNDDPFFGVGSLDFNQDLDPMRPLYPSFDVDQQDWFPSSGSTERKRIRIALKSMPGAGSEGGEWEVEVC